MTGSLNAGALSTAALPSPFGDVIRAVREGALTSGTRIDSPAAAGAIIGARRHDHWLSQQSLAKTTGVSRKFLVDLEAGHERSELGKTLAILAALGLSIEATDPLPRGSAHDPARRDYAQTFTQLISSRDYEFAIRMLAEYATASLKAGRPLLQRNPGSRTHTGPQPWPASPTTPHTGSASPHRPGPDTSNHSTQHGCPPSPTGASADP